MIMTAHGRDGKYDDDVTQDGLKETSVDDDLSVPLVAGKLIVYIYERARH